MNHFENAKHGTGEDAYPALNVLGKTFGALSPQRPTNPAWEFLRRSWSVGAGR